MAIYEVIKKGHKVGHRRLAFGEEVTPKELGVNEEDLNILVRRGVLRRGPKPKPPVSGPPVSTEPPVEPVPLEPSSASTAKKGKKDG